MCSFYIHRGNTYRKGSNVNKYSTRSHITPVFINIFSKSVKFQKSLSQRLILWNKLPVEVRRIEDCQEFKRILTQNQNQD